MPPDRTIEVAAFDDNSAVSRSRIGPLDDDLGEIELQNGTSVYGSVFNRSGDPVAGVVVTLREFDVVSLPNSISVIEASVKTDAQGRFRLPPHLGKSAICVVERCNQERGLPAIFVPICSEVSPPVVVPAIVELDGTKPELHIDLKEASTIKISGAVHWENGQPAMGVMATGWIFGEPTGVRVSNSITDEQGRYTVEVPSNQKLASVSRIGKHDADAAWNYAFAMPHPLALRTELQLASFQNVQKDIEDVNWVLRPDENLTKPHRNESEPERQFRKLRERYSAFRRITLTRFTLQVPIRQS